MSPRPGSDGILPLAHLLHHLLHQLAGLEQLVDLLRRSSRSRARSAGGGGRRSGAGPRARAASSRARSPRRASAGSRRRRAPASCWPSPGISFRTPCSGPIRRSICCAWRKSSKVNWPLRIRASIAACSSSDDGLLGALDQRQHVAHAEDPRRHPVGMEDLERVELLAGRGEHDRLAGDRLDRERGAAAGVAVELRQDDAVEGDPLLERLATLTASWPVIASSTSSDVRRLDRVADALELVHQRLVDLEAAGGVDDHRVEAVRRGRARGPRVAASTGILRVGAVDGDVDLRAELLELVDRGRALQVGGDERRACGPAPARCRASLAGGRRLAGALEAGEQDHRGAGRARARPRSEPISSVSSSWTTLTTCWPGVRLFSTSSPSGALAHAVDEVADDLEVDVGLEQREPDLAHRARDRLLVELAALAQVAEGAAEPV